jgi:hypothetical protein
MRERIAGPRGTGKPLEIGGKRAGHTTVGGDMVFRAKDDFTASATGG